MPILSITAEKGGKSLPTLMTIVPPDREISFEALQKFAPESKGNGAFLADLLSAFTAHERCGVLLYNCLFEQTTRDEWADRLDEFGDQTKKHVRICEDLIHRLGGNPMYVSPWARLTESHASKSLEVLLMSGSADPYSMELVHLETLLSAELKCHSNWHLLRDIAQRMPDSKEKQALHQAVEKVEPEEDEHVEWARSTWQKEIFSRSKL
ncbi:MAG TPA: ferritin-like domain-containing protein [Chroococcales cyanobacterium]|jgi:rubrerythrin